MQKQRRQTSPSRTSSAEWGSSPALATGTNFTAPGTCCSLSYVARALRNNCLFLVRISALASLFCSSFVCAVSLCPLLAVSQVGEVGELSEIFQWKGEVPRGLPGWNVAEKEHLGEELSDVLLYLVRLADICGIDLGQAALLKLVKNAKKYPVDESKSKASANRQASS